MIPSKCQEQLQSLTVATGVLGKVVEEVIRDVTKYVEKLADMTPAARGKATQRAVQEWKDRATAGSSSSRRAPSHWYRWPQSCSISALGRMPGSQGAALEKQQALETGRDPPVERALQLLDIAVAEADCWQRKPVGGEAERIGSHR